jgi:hypothetical protein
MRSRVVVQGVLVGALASVSSLACDAAEAEAEAIRLRPWCSQCLVVYSNAATINGADLSDIHLDQASTAGIKLVPGTAYNGRPFRLEIEPGTDRFFGVGVDDQDELVIAGAQFVGSKIALMMPGPIVIDLEITDYAVMPSWAANGAMVTAYRAQYLGPMEVPQDLCPSYGGDDDQWFTLVPGETYEQGIVTAAPRSVTIACVGEAVAKMKLMDFHPQGLRGASASDRQATLRMITADYCGTGQSFTETGTPVAWRDVQGLVKPPHGENVMEALWDEHGAICLSTPRLAETSEVAAVCSIPTCEGESFNDGAVWRTMLPSE